MKGRRGLAPAGLLRDQLAGCSLLVIFADERVLAGLERPDEDRRLSLAGNHLFAVELLALEFLGSGIVVLHDELDLRVRGYRDLRWRELVVLDRDLERRIVGPRE